MKHKECCPSLGRLRTPDCTCRPVNLKLVAFFLIMVVIIGLLVSMSSGEWISTISIWSPIALSSVCVQSEYPSTTDAKKRQCSFPFVMDGISYHDCLLSTPPESTTQKFWCSAICIFDKTQENTLDCTGSRVSSFSGYKRIQGLNQFDTTRFLQAIIILALLCAIAALIGTGLELFVRRCRRVGSLESTNLVLFILVPIFLLIAILILGTKAFFSQLGWSYWLAVAITLLAFIATIIYIVGYRQDHWPSHLSIVRPLSSSSSKSSSKKSSSKRVHHDNYYDNGISTISSTPSSHSPKPPPALVTNWILSDDTLSPYSTHNHSNHIHGSHGEHYGGSVHKIESYRPFRSARPALPPPPATLEEAAVAQQLSSERLAQPKKIPLWSYAAAQ